MDIIEILKGSSFIVQLVLLILVFSSFFSWAIIVVKIRMLRTVNAQNRQFLEIFWKSGSLDHIYTEAAALKDCPLANLFKSGYIEVQKILDQHDRSSGAMKLQGIDNVIRSLKKTYNIEAAFLEKRVNWLATLGSTAPFIGLFGTVWGIMNAFRGLASSGNASIQSVAPGIAEALIATAVGLACAIPAVLFYNFFLNRLKMVKTDLNNFCIDYINLVKRNLFT